MSERSFIETWRTRLLRDHAPTRALPLPPGDDCALVAGEGSYLYAADMLLEGVHFDLRSTTPRQVGRKALAVNLSDIAAMAGTPASVTVCLAVPRQGGQALADEVMDGLVALAEEFQVAIAGGDTNSWDGPLIVAVSITGNPHPRGSVTRRNAQVGDAIFVTGPLGGSLPSGRHLTFTPRIELARQLREQYALTSMIDLSDGLAVDLRHILTQSGVGAMLDRDTIPIHPDVPPGEGAGRLEHALTDGEDFELCFTLPEPEACRLLASAARPHPGVTRVGTIIAPPASSGPSPLLWSDGTPVSGGGYQHEFS